MSDAPPVAETVSGMTLARLWPIALALWPKLGAALVDALVGALFKALVEALPAFFGGVASSAWLILASNLKADSSVTVVAACELDGAFTDVESVFNAATANAAAFDSLWTMATELLEALCASTI